MNVRNLDEAISVLEVIPVRNLISPRRGAFEGGIRGQLVCPVTAMARHFEPNAGHPVGVLARVLDIYVGTKMRYDLIWYLVSLYDISPSREAGRQAVLKEMRQWHSWRSIGE